MTPTRARGRALAAVGLFLVAVRALAVAGEGLAVSLSALEPLIARGEPAALGVAWLATYAFLSGSVVAALSLVFHEIGSVTPEHLYAMLCGTRLGAAGFVVLVGVVDRLQPGGPRSLRGATGLGLLTFLATLAVYVPAALLGRLAVPSVLPRAGPFAPWAIDAPGVDWPFEYAVEKAGPIPVFLGAIVVLYASLWLFDRALAPVDPVDFRRRWGPRLRRLSAAFALGLAVAAVTTSVAFSVGILVPLFDRGFLDRREVLPYVMGANVGTLADTILVAAALGSGTGLALVLVLLAAVLAVTLAAFALYPAFRSGVEATLDGVVAGRAAFTAFLVALVLVPALLLLLR